MSKYTTEVRYICEVYADLDHSKGYNSIDSILTNAIPKIFDFDFPMFDESYRTVLEKKILKHYYTREISEETFGLWKLRLDAKLNEIMPYYNKLYNSELLEFNPLYTVNLTRDKNTDFDSTRNGEENITDHTTTSNRKDYEEARENENDGTLTGSTSDTVQSTVVTDGENTNASTRVTDSDTSSTSSSTTTSQSSTTSQGTSGNTKYELFSDTPQGALTGVDTETYLTNAKKSTDSGTTSGSTSGTGSETTSASGSGTNDETVTVNGSNTNDETVTTNGTNKGTRNDTTHAEETENISGNEVANGSVAYTRNRGDSDVVNSTEDYLEHVVGYEGTTGSKMLKEFRDTFLNIDMMVINELEPLFFQLW